MRDIYSLNGRHRYNRMHHYQIRKNKEGLVIDIYNPETGQHFMPYRKSERDGRLYILEKKTAGYIVTEYYKGKIELLPNPKYVWPF